MKNVKMMKLKKKKQPVITAEIEELRIKELKLFDSVDAKYCTLGYSVCYTRVPGGLIRTIVNSESMSQVFIPLDNTYFIN